MHGCDQCPVHLYIFLERQSDELIVTSLINLRSHFEKYTTKGYDSFYFHHHPAAHSRSLAALL